MVRRKYRWTHCQRGAAAAAGQVLAAQPLVLIFRSAGGQEGPLDDPLGSLREREGPGHLESIHVAK